MASNHETKQKAQKNIATGLKMMTILIALFLTGFGAALTFYAFSIQVTEHAPHGVWAYRSFIFFTWGVGLVCYYILYCFWGVCTQIAADNSFSIENETAMKRMGTCGLIIAAILAARFVFSAIIFGLQFSMLYDIAEAGLGLVFFVVCNALGRLVHNAYELKEDNDLTI